MTTTEELITELEEAYQDEVASALNYLANAQTLESVSGEEVAEELRADVQEEFNHAQRLADVLDATFDVTVPSTDELELDRQPDLRSDREYKASNEEILEVLRGVAVAESEAIERYDTLVKLADRAGYPDVRSVAEDLLADERQHLDETESLAREFTENNKELEY